MLVSIEAKILENMGTSSYSTFSGNYDASAAQPCKIPIKNLNSEAAKVPKLTLHFPDRPRGPTLA
jgi:hypothetical protein